MFSSFLTGSQVYGKPTKDSDVDLVILMSPDEARRLNSFSDQKMRYDPDRYPDSFLSCRFGVLNILVCTDPKQFAAWFLGTNECSASKPKNTAQATKVMAKFGVTQAKK